MSGDDQQHVLPIINLSCCNGCGLCAVLCSTHTIDMVGGKPLIARPGNCTYCEDCERYCPEGAIERPFTIVFAR